MPRVIRIVIIGVAAIIAALAAIWAFLFWTPPGRAALKQIIQSALGAATDSNVVIGSVDGAPPAKIDLRAVSFSIDGDDWLTVEHATLDWRPAALLRRAIEIDSVRIDGARLLEAPPKGDDDKPPRGLELPGRLPKLTIKELSITDFRVAAALVGEELRIDGQGAAAMGGSAFDVSIEANSSDERDHVSARLRRSDDGLDADIAIASKETGAIAALTKSGGAIFIEAKGDGPPADFKLEVASDLGAFGSVSGSLFGDFSRMEKLEFAANIDLGDRFANTARLLGATAQLQGAYEPTKDGGHIALRRLKSAIGTIAGDIAWRNRGDALARVDLDLGADLGADWRPDIRPYLGERLAVAGAIVAEGDAYEATGKVSASKFDADLNEVRSDLRRYARGPLVVSLKPNDALPAFIADGATAHGDAEFQFSGAISASGAELVAANGGAFRGEADYDFETRGFEVRGDVAATPATVALYAPSLVMTRNASGVINIKGDIERFSGTVAATTPPIRIGRAPLPAARLALAFADMPAAPSGEISIRALDGSRRLNANFARTPVGAWRFAGVNYAGADFELAGAGSFNPQTREGAIDAAYRGGETAEPWPGLPIAGDFAAKGALARNAASNALAVRADKLLVGDVALSGFEASAAGAMSDLHVEATIDEARFGDLSPLSSVDGAMTIRLDRAIKATIVRFSGELGGEALQLSAPAEVDFADGVAFRNLRATIGAKGSITVDGAVSKSRWRAALAATGAPIAGAASAIDLSVDLDTARNAPAKGAFTLTSLLSEQANAKIAGAFIWDGLGVRIRDNDTDPALDLDATLPLRLRRTPSLAIDTMGPLAGAAHYEGRVETIAGFLPAALQTLEGDLQFDGLASGALADPKLAGTLTIAKGGFTELSSGLSIVNIEAKAAATAALRGSRIDFEATGSGPGQATKTVFADGALTLGAATDLRSTIRLDRARLSAGPINSAEATGSVDFSGPFHDLVARGDLSVRELNAEVFTPETTGLVDINVVRVDGTGGTPPAAASRRPPRLTYAIRITGDDKIFVRGRGVQSEWRSDIRIVGRATAPLVIGDLSLKKGDITFAGRQFDMTKGVIAFDALSPNNPALDLRAVRETRSGTTASIVIAGRARAPKISLASTPALPQEDIMALVLFDKPATELSALESLQVAEGLAELGGIGPFGGRGPTAVARSALGLDLLSLDFDQQDSAASTLTVGKYVADGLFVSATQDARGENGSVRIEYEIDQSFTVETELRQDGDQTVSANWKRDF